MHYCAFETASENPPPGLRQNHSRVGEPWLFVDIGLDEYLDCPDLAPSDSPMRQLGVPSRQPKKLPKISKWKVLESASVRRRRRLGNSEVEGDRETIGMLLRRFSSRGAARCGLFGCIELCFSRCVITNDEVDLFDWFENSLESFKIIYQV